MQFSDSNEGVVQWMLKPILKDDFFSIYFEKKVLHIKRSNSDYYSSLLKLEDLSNILYSRTLKYPDIKIVNSKDDSITHNKYTSNGNKIRIDQLLKYFQDGGTIIFAALHDNLASMGCFSDFLSKEFRQRFQTNVYLTPKNSQGFKVHYDTHDVFVLQTEGSKLWKIYESSFVLPNKSMEFDPAIHKAGKLKQEILLKKGDLLYIPRGIMHEATSTEDISIHITTGLLGVTWADLIVETVIRESREDESLRKYVDMISDINTCEAYLKEKIQHIEKNASAKKSTDVFFQELINNQKPNLDKPIENILYVDNINTSSKFFVRKNIIVSVKVEANKLKMSMLGNDIYLPHNTRPIIEFLLNDKMNSGPISILDLPGDIDDSGKLTLVKRFIREGLISVVHE